ncbi:DUF3575 domain-containing protein [Chryseolinea soli]|uniref:DUF3575 domain-containing protein n=1 Tax=Chryseolinea soli TaxID=2321403 RepID=A0A385SYH6_9BACT|nr:DUF3575 domain-containing protein [Chryseolinea soli]AYB35157.1 DUF3575 domain-containing protein [Chryseolinea soli]
MKQIIITILCLIAVGRVDAQNPSPQRKNTIKIDLTSRFLYRNAFILSYERITKPNQSLVLSAGYQEFPKVTTFAQNVGVKDDLKKNGFKFGMDYRFYLKKENKYDAPHGVYIGPYFTYHHFGNERIIEVDNDGTIEQADLDTKFSILNVGIQLGYQFVIHNRWTIDLAFVGPSVSHYKYTLNIGGDYTFNKDDIENEIILDLLDRFPFLDDAISNKEATSSGKLDTWSFGYRYQFTVGYHFGRKK